MSVAGKLVRAMCAEEHMHELVGRRELKNGALFYQDLGVFEGAPCRILRQFGGPILGHPLPGKVPIPRPAITEDPCKTRAR